MLRWIPACDAIEKNVFFPVGLSPRARQQARVKARWRGSHLAGRPHDQRGAISAAPADWTATCPHASQSVSQAVWGRPGVCAEGRLSQQRATKLRCPYHKVYHRYTGGSSYYPLPSTCSYNEIPTLKEYHHRLSRARMRRGAVGVAGRNWEIVSPFSSSCRVVARTGLPPTQTLKSRCMMLGLGLNQHRARAKGC